MPTGINKTKLMHIYTVRRIAHIVKTKRDYSRLTRAQLAEASGLNYNTIIKLERGENMNPTISTLLSLCRAFDCDVNDFLR